MTRDLPRFVRRPLSSEAAADILRHRLATREARFLELARSAIFGHPRSPYLPLLKAAGCELGDLQALVADQGLEGALSRLAEAGVYLAFDEFKGQKAVVRGSQRLTFAEGDFDNPGLRPHIEAWSGGTRGPGTSVKMTLSYFSDLAVNTAVTFQMQGLSGYDHVVWLQGFTPGFVYASLGRLPLAWFYPVQPLPQGTLLASCYMTMVSRALGRPLPSPQFLDLREPDGLVHWLAARRSEGRSVCVTTYASSAVRVCLAAQEAGISLEGVCFITLGEPFTAAKQRVVGASGARVLVRYAFTEAGIIGYLCGTPRASDDIHFFSDSYGLVQRSRKVGDSELTVDAFVFTSLLPTAPKILLNVESGDCGRLERRVCSCALDELGLRDHISEIRSFEKLNGEGMTFVRADLLRILEEVLPSAFGGTSADYQVLEQEGEHGVLRLLLIVSPSVVAVDEAAIRRVFLEELERESSFSPYGARFWRQAGTVEVRRQQPLATKAGKILPFHLQGNTGDRPSLLRSG